MPAAARIVGLAIAYYLAARLGLAFAYVGENVSPIWPPTGLAIAALLLWGRRYWPGVTVGTIAAVLHSHTPPPAIVGIAIGNTLEAVLAATLLKQIPDFRPALDRVRDAAAFISRAVIIAPTVSAAIGVASLALAGTLPPVEVPHAMVIWWIGDAIGALSVGAFLLSWASGRFRMPSRRRLREFAVLAVGLVFTACLAFGGRFPYTYMIVPFIVWAALRFETRGATLALLLVAIPAVWLTSHGFGPFARTSLAESLVYLLSFMAVLGGTALILAGLMCERRTAEESLWRANEAYRAVIEASPLAIVTSDLHGAILTWNPAAERIFGYSAAEVLGQQTPLTPKELRIEYDIWRERSLSGEFIQGLETRRRRRDGTQVDVSISTAPVRDAGGQTVGIVGIVADISEKKQAEALRDQLVAILDSTTDLVGSSAPDGRVIYMNRGGRRLLGFPEDADLRGRHISDFHPPHVYAFVWKEAIPAAIRDGAWMGETTLRRIDGQPIPVSQVILAHRDADGTVTHLSTIIRDIGALKQAEHSARESERELRAVLDAMSELLFVLDRDGTYLKVIVAPRARFIGRPDDRVGQRMHDIHPPEIADALVGAIRRALDESEPVEVEYQLTIAGQPAWYLARISPMSSDRVVWVTRDVTERKRLETQLLQAQKMEAVGRLAGGVAHDFNNLLTTVLAVSELVLSELPPNSPHRTDLAEIRDAGRRGALLTRQLLTFSRKQTFEPREVDLNIIVDGIATMLRRVIGEDIQLDTRLAPDLPPVRIDPVQVEQVLLNLAVNARDAMPHGGRLELETATATLTDEALAEWPDAEPGEFVRLTVQDTGHGIDAEIMRHIFEPFYTTKGTKGTGLGLATVYGIVQQSGGSIAVASAPGGGARFDVYFPEAD